MNNILWFDLETTGLDFRKHGIIQIAACVEKEGRIVDAFNEKQKPDPMKVIDEKALKVNGHTAEEINTFQDSKACYLSFNRFLERNHVRGDKETRYIPAGYNSRFDLEFLSQYFEEQSAGPYAFWEHLQFNPIDPFPVIVLLNRYGKLNLESCKLETACKHFGIVIEKAHDANSDIMATRELTQKVMELFK